jgi:glutamyl-Q tRNA(Asp) synthetase
LTVTTLSARQSLALAQQRNNVSLNRCSYSGRFAPSPTGPLHFGSLITALASYCEAKSQQGQWLVRIEDTDIPRIQHGAEQAILTALEAFGFEWDQPVIRQQNRLELYETALEQLKKNNLIYACCCSRKQLQGFSIYPKTCQNQHLSFDHHAIRLKVQDQNICFEDLLQDNCCENLAHSIGDFVLKRRDGIISYQLAVVVDDALQGVTHVVRGADLLDNTARQIWLGQCLNLPKLNYCHIPLAMNDQGQKLSKQNLALPLDLHHAPQLIQAAIKALHQSMVDIDQPRVMLKQAVEQWDIGLIPKQVELMGVFE